MKDVNTMNMYFLDFNAKILKQINSLSQCIFEVVDLHALKYIFFKRTSSAFQKYLLVNFKISTNTAVFLVTSPVIKYKTNQMFLGYEWFFA